MTIDTAHKAPLIVHTAAGVFVEANGQTLTFDPEGIAGVEGAVNVPDVGACWYIAGVAPGTTSLKVVGGGSQGTVDVTVTAAPLTVTFGEVVAR